MAKRIFIEEVNPPSGLKKIRQILPYSDESSLVVYDFGFAIWSIKEGFTKVVEEQAICIDIDTVSKRIAVFTEENKLKLYSSRFGKLFEKEINLTEIIKLFFIENSVFFVTKKEIRRVIV